MDVRDGTMAKNEGADTRGDYDERGKCRRDDGDDGETTGKTTGQDDGTRRRDKTTGQDDGTRRVTIIDGVYRTHSDLRPETDLKKHLFICHKIKV